MGHLYHGYVSHNQRVSNVGKTMINHPPVIPIFIGGIVETIPSRLGGLRHCFTHIGEVDGICIW